jgi:hypothetical protein
VPNCSTPIVCGPSFKVSALTAVASAITKSSPDEGTDPDAQLGGFVQVWLVEVPT